MVFGGLGRFVCWGGGTGSVAERGTGSNRFGSTFRCFSGYSEAARISRMYDEFDAEH